MMDLIDRQEAIDSVIKALADGKSWYYALSHLPTAEKIGKWENIDVIHDRADAKITDWQQSRCSVCGKWHTKPYLYGIVLDPYCPSCGARMVKE